MFGGRIRPFIPPQITQNPLPHSLWSSFPLFLLASLISASIPKYEMCPGPPTYDEDGSRVSLPSSSTQNRTELANGSTKQYNLLKQRTRCSLPLAVILAMFWLYHAISSVSLACHAHDVQMLTGIHMILVTTSKLKQGSAKNGKVLEQHAKNDKGWRRVSSHVIRKRTHSETSQRRMPFLSWTITAE